jgi:heme/copper-type cytochrome/quinol oxidase subunit 2
MGTLPDDDAQVQQTSTLLFGVMGIATFIIFFFVLVITIVFIFTSACPMSERLTIRSIFIGVFGIIIIILIFADREPRYVSADMEPHVSCG